MTKKSKSHIAKFVVYCVKGGKYVREHSVTTAKKITDTLDAAYKHKTKSSDAYPMRKFVLGVMRNDIDRRSFPVVVAMVNHIIKCGDRLSSLGNSMDVAIKSQMAKINSYQELTVLRETIFDQTKIMIQDLRGNDPWIEYVVEFILIDGYLYMNSISCLAGDEIDLDTLDKMMAITSQDTFSVDNMKLGTYGSIPCDNYAMVK